jgi:ribonuclease HI
VKNAIVIYTDGSCSPNPGPGGYGVFLRRPDKTTATYCGGYRLTTNNRMEILAVIEALKVAPRNGRVVIYSDSQYVVNALTKGWAFRWRKNGWWRSRGQRARNKDLWAAVLQALQARRKGVEFRWVRGHAGIAGNERADRLARRGRSQRNPSIDSVYEEGEATDNASERKVINDFADRVCAVRDDNEELRRYRGRRLRFSAVVDSIGEMISYGHAYPTMLLREIDLHRGSAGEKRVATLLWFKQGKWANELRSGTRFSFNARVVESDEGWRLERPANISIEKR